LSTVEIGVDMSGRFGGPAPGEEFGEAAIGQSFLRFETLKSGCGSAIQRLFFVDF
jgi:hypothetical protein